MRLKDMIAKNVLGTYRMFIACVENFLQVRKVERVTHLISFWGHVRYFGSLCGSIREYQNQKSPSPDVSDNKICLKCRMASPFVSAFRYDPKEACKHTW